jgi:hypothetical protein
MSVKSTKHVEEYVENVMSIQAAIIELQKFADSLHAPENGELPNMHYGHTGSVDKIATDLAEVVKFTRGFWKG